MGRPLRIEYSGAVYHVTSRGNERKNIFRSDKDRYLFLRVLSEMLKDYLVYCHAWVLMDNHYHLLLETSEANLSRALRYLNGVYTLRFNRKNHRVGHLFQGRFKAIHVEKGSHLLELCRYIVLNPVRARIVKRPEDWKWSSYRTTLGIDNKEPLLVTDWVLSQFGRSRKAARKSYQKFVAEGIKGKKNPLEEVTGQIYYGSEIFKEKVFKLIKVKDPEIPTCQKFPERPSVEKLLMEISGEYGVEIRHLTQKAHKVNEPRDVAMYLLRTKGGLGLRAIGEKFGVKYSAVSHRVWKVKKRMEMDQSFRLRVANK